MEEDDEQVTTKQPIIIAIGDSPAEITQYEIKIDANFIIIKADKKFEYVFRVFYACFHIFGLTYDNSLLAFMSFFDTYIYKIEKSTPYSVVTGVYNQILSRSKKNLMHY